MNKPMRFSWIILVTLTVCDAFSTTSFADDVSAGDESANYSTEVVLDGLDNPTGLTIRPGAAVGGPPEFFLAESGAGRVLHVSGGEEVSTREVVDGFTVGEFGDRGYRVGPLALGFLTRSKLVVAGGVKEDGQSVVAVYVLPTGDEVLSATSIDHSVGPLSPGNGEAPLGFLGLVKTEAMAFVACGAEGTQGQLFKSEIEANRLEYLQALGSEQDALESEWPAGVTLTPPSRPTFLATSRIGSLDASRDSQLVFHIPATGAVALVLPTGLHDVVGLAYSASEQLYAIDFSWADESLGGVYRLDDARVDGRQVCRPVKIASVPRPTSLVFGPDGSMFVTAFGEGANEKQGQLVRITGEF